MDSPYVLELTCDKHAHAFNIGSIDLNVRKLKVLKSCS